MLRRLSRTLITLFPQKKDKPHLQIIWMVIKCLAWISRSICVMFSIRGWEIRRVVSWRWGIEYVSGVDDTFHLTLLLQDWVTQSESTLLLNQHVLWSHSPKLWSSVAGPSGLFWTRFRNSHSNKSRIQGLKGNVSILFIYETNPLVDFRKRLQSGPNSVALTCNYKS